MNPIFSLFYQSPSGECFSLLVKLKPLSYAYSLLGYMLFRQFYLDNKFITLCASNFSIVPFKIILINSSWMLDVGCVYFLSSWYPFLVSLTFMLTSGFWYIIWLSFTYFLVSIFKSFFQEFLLKIVHIIDVWDLFWSWKYFSSFSTTISFLSTYSVILPLYLLLSNYWSNLSTVISTTHNSTKFV